MNWNNRIDPGLIGFDIDGVVADTAGAFIRLARSDYGVDNISVDDITDFVVEDCLPLDAELVDEIFNRLLVAPTESGLKPMAGAVKVLRNLSREAPLTFVTARPLKEPIELWLENVLGRNVFSNARLIAIGDHDGKADYIKELGLEYFVDDRAETCMALAKKDITPIVFNQPWNRGRHNLKSVDSWDSIKELCLVVDDI
ncbi:MAG: hypothetical protein U9N60_07600 [Thermodesulfobacteriota bacterium]|nr:hypothetical protein [Thermodesulfobacteriota bacterium]